MRMTRSLPTATTTNNIDDIVPAEISPISQRHSNGSELVTVSSSSDLNTANESDVDNTVPAEMSPISQRRENSNELAIVSSSFQLYTPTESVRYIEVTAQFHRESSELKREIEANSDKVVDHETESDTDSESEFDLTSVTMLSDFDFTEESIDISDFEFDNGLTKDHVSKTDPVIDHEAESENDSESDFDLTFVTMLSDFEFTEESIDISELEFDNGLVENNDFTSEQISISNLDLDSSMFSVMPIVQQNTSNDALLHEYCSKYGNVAETSKSEESKIDEIISNPETDFVPNSCSEMATEQIQNAPEMLPCIPVPSFVTGGSAFDTTVGLEHDLESESRLVCDSECEANATMVSESSTVTGFRMKIDQNSKSDTDSKEDSELDCESVKPHRESLSELKSSRIESKSFEKNEERAESADQGTLGAEEEESKTQDDVAAAKIHESEIVANHLISSILDNLFGCKSTDNRIQSDTSNACAKEHLTDPQNADEQSPNTNPANQPVQAKKHPTGHQLITHLNWKE
eukprot:Seg378.8 transcript_id=Seg378.8/GoldUCD/mRNA.D3Y31 product="hypothetical protein" protein_id=Seg378.8/GoldUCD/D3Y31